MNEIDVSIIVLTFNSEKYIRRCLLSLARQTYKNIEVVIVDAGSTDGTHEIASSFRDSRFKWLELPKSDMGAARNHGMQCSRGRFICFLDSDDFYLPSKVENQVRAFEKNPLVDVVYCSAWHFRTGADSRVGLKKISDQPQSLRDYLLGRNHNLSTMCIRRTVWEAGYAFGEGERGRYGEEWRFQLSLAQHAVPMLFCPDPQTVVELRPDSHTAWSLQSMMKRQAIDEIERVGALLTDFQLNNVNVTEILDNFRFKLVIALLLDGRKQEALREVSLIVDSRTEHKSKRLVLSCWFVPQRLLRQLLCMVWTWRQNSSFDWQTMPASLKGDFEAVHMGSSYLFQVSK